MDSLRIIVEKSGKPSEHDFDKSIWLDQKTRESIWRDQHNKCCYCEKNLELKRESDVEHFRPKGKVTEDKDHPGYWWLSYTWENLMYSCKHCNSAHKANRFPLRDPLKRVYDERADLSDEEPKLINPYLEDPEAMFVYEAQGADTFVYILPSGTDTTGKAQVTIEVCGLNRTMIMQQRAQKIRAIRAAIRALCAGIHTTSTDLKNEAKKDIRRLIDPSQSFSGMARYFLKQADLEEYVK